MAGVLTRARVTRQEYRALPEGPPYFELIDGELIEMNRPSRAHQHILRVLIRVWDTHLLSGIGGELTPEPNLYLPGIEDVYHPDLAYVAPDRRSISRNDGIYGAPDVVCEILSPSTARTDRGLKRDAYRRAGVRHVWLVDQVRPVMVEEFVLAEDGFYRLHAVVTAPAEWEPSAFPGWRVSLAELDAVAAADEE